MNPSPFRAAPPTLLAASLCLALAACGPRGGTDADQAAAPPAAPAPPVVRGLSEASNFRLGAGEPSAGIEPSDLPPPVFADGRTGDMLRVQILLDRARFSPGVIDGRPGDNARQAIEAYQQANALAVDGMPSPALIMRMTAADPQPVLRRYKISESDVAGPFAKSIPEGMEAQAKLDRLGYTSPEEKLAEKFHMDVDLLRAMNPDADFGSAGVEIVVPDRGNDELPAPVRRIQVDKRLKAVRAYDVDGRLAAIYPATIGSTSLPSPSGELTVLGVAQDPTYHYDPEKLSFGDADHALTLPPGPNNPVGSVWIDLSRDGYGIHGTPDPALIGKTASHGCVRLTNWDAEELASAVENGVTVEFVGDEAEAPAKS